MASGYCTSYESSLDAGTEDWIFFVARKLLGLFPIFLIRRANPGPVPGGFLLFLEELTLDVGPELTEQISDRSVAYGEAAAAHGELEPSIIRRIIQVGNATRSEGS